MNGAFGSQILINYFGFEVFTVVIMKRASYLLKQNAAYSGTGYTNVSEECIASIFRSKCKRRTKPADFLEGLLSDPECIGSMFFRNTSSVLHGVPSLKIVLYVIMSLT
jgi:hypothetical protein